MPRSRAPARRACWCSKRRGRWTASATRRRTLTCGHQACGRAASDARAGPCHASVRRDGTHTRYAAVYLWCVFGSVIFVKDTGDGCYSLVFLKTKDNRMKSARNVRKISLNFFNALRENIGLAKSKSLKLRRSLKTTRHKIPADSYESAGILWRMVCRN